MNENKIRASRNRTITILPNETDGLTKDIATTADVSATGFKDDVIVNGNLLDCIGSIPDKHFDLIIIDPPYNIDKDFHGIKFQSRKEEEYEDYLRSWFHKVCDKLKDNGTLYMCGDWRCTSSMQRIIEERLTVINRITWQREKGRGALNNYANSG